MPGTQVVTPEVETEVVNKEVVSLVKKSVVEEAEQAVTESGDILTDEKVVEKVVKKAKAESAATVKEPNEESQDSQNGNSEKSFVTNGSAVEEEFKEVKKTKVESSKRKSITEEEPEVSPKKLKASLAELIDLSESDDDDDLMHFLPRPEKSVTCKQYMANLEAEMEKEGLVGKKKASKREQLRKGLHCPKKSKAPSVAASSSSIAGQSLLPNVKDVWSHWTCLGGTGRKSQMRCNYCGREQQKRLETCRGHLIRSCPRTPQHVRVHFQQFEKKRKMSMLEEEVVDANLAKGDISDSAELSGNSPSVAASSSSTAGQSLLPNVKDVWSHWTCLGGTGRKSQMRCNYCGREQQKRLETCRGHLIRSCPRTPQHVRNYFQQYEEKEEVTRLEANLVLANLANGDKSGLAELSASTVAASSTSTGGQSLLPNISDLWSHWTCVSGAGKKSQERRMKCNYCGREQQKRAEKCRGHLIKSCPQTPQHVRDYFQQCEKKGKVTMLEEEVVYANLAKGDKSGLVELSAPAVVASSSSTADQSLLSNARDLWSHWAWVSGTGKKTQVKCNYCGREQQKSSLHCRGHLIKLCPKAPQHVRDYFQQYETIGVMAVLLGDAAGPFQEKQPAASSSTVAASSTSTAGQSLLPKVSDLWSHWTWVSGTGKKSQMKCNYCGREQQKISSHCRGHLIKSCPLTPQHVRTHFQQYEEKEEVTRLEANLVLANLAKGDKSGLAELSGDSLAVVASSSSTTGQSLLPDISDLWSHWTCLGGKGRKAQIKCNYCGREQQKRLETCRGHLIKSCPQTPQHVRDYFQKYEASDVLAVLLGDAAGPFQEKQPAASSSTVAASSTSTDESEKFEEDEGDLDDDMSDLMELPEVDPPTERAIKFAIKILARHSINVRQHMATIVNNIVSKFSILYRFHEFLLDPSTKKPYELGLMRGVLAKHASLVPPQQTKSHGTPNIPVSANSLLKLYDKTIRPVFVHDQQTRSSEAAPLILTLGPVNSNGGHFPSEAFLKVYLEMFAFYKKDSFSDLRTSDQKAPKVNRTKIMEILTWAKKVVRKGFFAPLIFEESLILNPSDLFPTSIESEQLKRSLNLPESWLNILSNKTVFARHLDRLISYTMKIDGLMLTRQTKNVGLAYVLAENPIFFCTTGSIWTPIFWLICLWYAGYTGYLSAMTRRAAHAKSVKQGGSASANPRLYRRLLESAKGGRAVHWIPLLPGLVKSTASAHLYELALIKLSKRLGGGFNTQSGNSSLVTLPIMESIPDEVLYEFGVVLLVHAFYNVFAGTAIVLSETTNTTIDLWQTRRKAILAEDEQEMASEAEKPRTIEEILASFN